MQSSKISVVITDLDNTLFDWVETWFRSFTALVDRLVIDSGVEREQLLDEIRDVHQRHGTSEYAFLIEELPSLKVLHPDDDLARLYDGAIHDFRKARKASLKLFPGVMETLQRAYARASGGSTCCDECPRGFAKRPCGSARGREPERCGRRCLAASGTRHAVCGAG
jgi:FMN phosphatase YigB (HAD superfamily)